LILLTGSSFSFVEVDMVNASKGKVAFGSVVKVIITKERIVFDGLHSGLNNSIYSEKIGIFDEVVVVVSN
jgi:hypothetical protein